MESRSGKESRYIITRAGDTRRKQQWSIDIDPPLWCAQLLQAGEEKLIVPPGKLREARCS